MKGLELLVKGQEYIVTTRFNAEGYDNLVFTGFYQENPDVTLACFEDVQRGYESFFDISDPNNQVFKTNLTAELMDLEYRLTVAYMEDKNPDNWERLVSIRKQLIELDPKTMCL